MKITIFIYSGGTPFGWFLANALVFKKVRKLLGLERCRVCLSGAAPLMKETLEFFFSLNIPLMEVYGMSESSGKHVHVYMLVIYGQCYFDYE